MGCRHANKYIIFRLRLLATYVTYRKHIRSFNRIMRTHIQCNFCILDTVGPTNSVLIIQVSLYNKESFGTTIKCVDYTGVLIFKCPDYQVPLYITHGHGLMWEKGLLISCTSNFNFKQFTHISSTTMSWCINGYKYKDLQIMSDDWWGLQYIYLHPLIVHSKFVNLVAKTTGECSLRSIKITEVCNTNRQKANVIAMHISELWYCSRVKIMIQIWLGICLRLLIPSGVIH